MAKILVIDDVASVRNSIASYLEDLGHSVEQAESGEAGIQLASKCSPELVMVDLRMPGLSGLEVLRHFRMSDDNLPVLIVSGTGEIRDAIEALRQGAWNFILKPIASMDIIRHAVENALERKRLRAENAEYSKNLQREVESKTADLKSAIQQLEMEVDTRRRAERTAVLSEERLASLVRAVPDVIFQLNDKFEIQFLSDSIRRFGIDPADWIQRRFMDFFVQEDRDSIDFRLRGLLNSGAEVVRTDARVPQADGSVVHMEIFIDVLDEKLANGSSQRHLLGVARDVSSKVRADIELKQFSERMRQSQKMEIMGQLASGVAHDFNNLLTAILGNAELIKGAHGVPTDVGKRADAILTTSLRATAIIRQLLAFGRRQPAEKKVLKINDVLREVIGILSHTLVKNVQIHAEFAEENPEVMADLAQLESAIINLGINARDAMSNGGMLTLRSSVVSLNGEEFSSGLKCEQGTYVRIDVEDNGSGMEAAVQKRIFEPFFTTKEPGKGTGLGLPAVYTFVQNHFGTLHVVSELNRGTCFSVYLRKNVDQEARSLDNLESNQLMHGSGTILIADDQDVVRNFAERALRELGYRVLTATNGLEAVEMYQRQKPIDLVVLDLSMPEMDGFSAFKRIRTVDSNARVLLSSGMINRDIEVSFIKEGGKGTLWKPFGVAYLSQVVSHAIKRN